MQQEGRQTLTQNLGESHPLEPLTSEQWDVLERYSWLQIPLAEVRRIMRPVMDFDFDSERRWLDSTFLVPDPGILITRNHIDAALSKKREGVIGVRDLVHWATMVLMNNAYELDSRDE